MAVTKGSTGTVYRARATKPGTPLTGDPTKQGKQLKRRPLHCAVQEFAFAFTPLSDTKRKSLCLAAEWSFTGFLSCSIESFRHMQMEGALSMNIQIRQCKCSRSCIVRFCYAEPENRTVRLKTSTPQPPAVCQSVNFLGQIIGGQTYFLFFIFLFLSSFSPSQVSCSLMFMHKT